MEKHLLVAESLVEHQHYQVCKLQTVMATRLSKKVDFTVRFLSWQNVPKSDFTIEFNVADLVKNEV